MSPIKNTNRMLNLTSSFNKESEPYKNKINYEEEKVALVLGITSDLSSPCLCNEIRVYQYSNICD